MVAVKAYLLSVCGASLLCAAAHKFLGQKGGAAGAGKMITGLFLALTVLKPLSSVDIGMLQDFSFSIDADADQAVQRGEEESKKMMAQIIKNRTAAYILQKAEALRVEITAEVILSNDVVPIPQKVYLSGSVAPYAKKRLQTVIEQDLGIAKENQIWT